MPASQPYSDAAALELQAVQERALWDRWREHRDADARARLLAIHVPYARIVAATYFRKRSFQDVDFDEYLQFASIGLLEAVNRYDPAAGVQFRTFAARRMHGAIVDGLKRLTERQQQADAGRRLTHASAGDEDGEAHPREQVLRYVADAGIAFALAWVLEGTGMIASENASELSPFYRSVELRELRQRVLDLVKALPQPEREIVHGHYLQDEPFERIASRLGVSKGRVSQLHRQALDRLRRNLRGPPSCDLWL